MCIFSFIISFIFFTLLPPAPPAYLASIPATLTPAPPSGAAATALGGLERRDMETLSSWATTQLERTTHLERRKREK